MVGLTMKATNVTHSIKRIGKRPVKFGLGTLCAVALLIAAIAFGSPKPTVTPELRNTANGPTWGCANSTCPSNPSVALRSSVLSQADADRLYNSAYNWIVSNHITVALDQLAIPASVLAQMMAGEAENAVPPPFDVSKVPDSANPAFLQAALAALFRDKVLYAVGVANGLQATTAQALAFAQAHNAATDPTALAHWQYMITVQTTARDVLLHAVGDPAMTLGEFVNQNVQGHSVSTNGPGPVSGITTQTLIQNIQDEKAYAEYYVAQNSKCVAPCVPPPLPWPLHN